MTKANLKTILSNHINNLENLKEELNDLTNEEELYLNLLNLLDDENYNKIYDNIDIISLIIPILLDNTVANKITDKLFNIVYRLKEIENICGDDAKEEKEYEINVKSFASIKNFFEQQCRKLELRENEIKKIYSLDRLMFTRRVLAKLCYSQKINSYEINQLPYILTEANVSVENQIRAIEIIRKHNQLLNSKINNGKIIEKTYVEMMIDTEFDSYDSVYVDDFKKKKEYDNMFEFYRNWIDNIENEEEIKELIDKPSLEENPNTLKFEYVMIRLLNYYIKKMIEIKNMIYDNDCYCDEDLKKEIVNEFNAIKRKYNKIKYVYNTEKLKLERKDIIDTGLPSVNNIFYAKTKNENVYIEDDIKEISNENLEKVEVLLNKLRTNTLTSDEFKPLIENKKFRGYKELRKDQIRIIYIHLNKNNYLIVGVGTKKTNNDLALYKRMVERYIDYDLENLEDCLQESSKIKIKVNDYIEKNKRKGSR